MSHEHHDQKSRIIFTQSLTIFDYNKMVVSKHLTTSAILLQAKASSAYKFTHNLSWCLT